MKEYPRIYKALTKSGHSGLTAITIILDAKRGKRFALDWIRMIHHINRR